MPDSVSSVGLGMFTEGKRTRSCLEVLGDSPIKNGVREKGRVEAQVVAHSAPRPGANTRVFVPVGRKGGYTTGAQETAML